MTYDSLVMFLLGFAPGPFLLRRKETMRVMLAALIVGVFAMFSTAAAAGELSAKETKRIQEAVTVLKEIHTVPDKDIPQ